VKGHHIEQFADGSAAFASRLDAWHRLGIVTRECMTGAEVMVKAQLGGWNVRKLSMTATEITAEGVSTVEVPDKFATVRTHPVTGAVDYLGTVGTDYVVRQNEEQIALLDILVDQSGARHFETAGSLRGGTQTFETMKLPRTMRVAGVDEVDLYLVVLNSHDGSSAPRGREQRGHRRPGHRSLIYSQGGATGIAGGPTGLKPAALRSRVSWCRHGPTDPGTRSGLRFRAPRHLSHRGAEVPVIDLGKEITP
jgi:hypothetical protein